MFVVTFDMGDVAVGPFDTWEQAECWLNGNEDGFIAEVEAPKGKTWDDEECG